MYMMYICVNCTSLISLLAAESQSSQSNSSVISRLLSSAQVTPKTHILLTLCFIMWVRDVRRHSLQIEVVVVVTWWLFNRALADLLCVDVLDWAGVQCIICMFICSGVLKLPYNCCQPRDTYLRNLKLVFYFVWWSSLHVHVLRKFNFDINLAVAAWISK